jgi:hypothetical protein
MLPEKMNVSIQKNSEIAFSFTSLKDSATAKISLVYFSGNNEKKLMLTHLKKESGLIQFKHKFKRKGSYDVHLKMNADIVATYTIHVI